LPSAGRKEPASGTAQTIAPSRRRKRQSLVNVRPATIAGSVMNLPKSRILQTQNMRGCATASLKECKLDAKKRTNMILKSLVDSMKATQSVSFTQQQGMESYCPLLSVISA
jgi:hypothetical protein